MSVLLATGVKELDLSLQNALKAKQRIEYLEELEYAIISNPDTQVLILSEYIPSLAEEPNKNYKYQSLLENFKYSKKNNVRVIFLTTSDIPKWVLGKLFTLGVYDLILTDGNVNDETIKSFFFNPTTKKQAEELISTLEENQRITSFEQEETTVSNDSYIYNEESIHNEYDVQEEQEDEVVEQEKHLMENQEGLNKVVPKTKETIVVNREYENETKEVRNISFWGVSPGVGTRTIAQSFAKNAAERGAKVLFVELDYLRPSFAVTSGLTHPTKNLLQLAMQQVEHNDFDIEMFIAKPNEIKVQKKSLKKVINDIPTNLHFLALPKDYRVESFPEIEEGKEFIDELNRQLKSLKYDLIIFNLPSEVNNLFSYPIMLNMDKIYNIMTLHPAHIQNYLNLREMLEKSSIDMDCIQTILNKVPKGISKEQGDSIINEKTILNIPYDLERTEKELNIQMGSPLIDEKVNELLNHLGLEDEKSENKREKKRLINF